MRKKLLLFLLIVILAAAVLAVYYVRQNLKDFAAQKLSRLLDKQINIGKVSGGIFDDVRLHQISVLIPVKDSRPVIFLIDSARLNIDLIQFLAHRACKNGPKDVKLFFKGGQILLANNYPLIKDLSGNVDFQPQNGSFENVSCDLTGKVNLLNNFIDFKAKASGNKDKINVNSLNFADTLIFFGLVDAANNKFLLNTNSHIKLKGDFASKENLCAELRLNHLNLGDTDISTRLEFKGNIIEQDDSRRLAGHIYSSESVVNLKPINEINLRFSIDRDHLILEHFDWGQNYILLGEVALREPFSTDLQFMIDEARMRDLVSLFSYGNQDLIRGIMTADIAINGRLRQLATKGHLEIKDGRMGNIDFERMKVNFRGEGPILYVSKSRVEREEGDLFLEGSADLRAFGRNIFLKDLKMCADGRTMIWDGWDISKADDAPQLKLEKSVDENLKVKFRTFMNDENLIDQPKKDEWELQYKMGKKKIKMRLKDQEDFVGLEHKNEF